MRVAFGFVILSLALAVGAWSLPVTSAHNTPSHGVSTEECSTCRGSGRCPACMGSGSTSGSEKCGFCQGKGSCPACNGCGRR
jgi:hypothetical protein